MAALIAGVKWATTTVREPEAEIVRRIFSEHVAGETPREMGDRIAFLLRRKGCIRAFCPGIWLRAMRRILKQATMPAGSLR
jgi:hypothetical protein